MFFKRVKRENPRKMQKNASGRFPNQRYSGDMLCPLVRNNYNYWFFAPFPGVIVTV